MCQPGRLCLILCAVEEMAGTHARTATSPTVGGAPSPPGGAAEAAGEDEWLSGLRCR